ncbi:MAG: hypothetical protein J6W94_04585 [Bacteroidales bacterium]|nr:hypothetical protein [Bacteroidales bacterium]
MRPRAVISALLVCLLAFAPDGLAAPKKGRRIEAGPSYLEPLQVRDSVLVLDQFRYGMVIRDVPEGTSIGLPNIDAEETLKGKLLIVDSWKRDTINVIARKDSVKKYDIRAWFTVAPLVNGEYELFPLTCLVGLDTLVYIHQMLDVKEPSIDLETFQPNDIKPQVKFPVTFAEAIPWVMIGLFAIAILVLIFAIYSTIERKQKEKPAEPAHIRALRKLDKFRGEKHCKPENQKNFYSGVTDALREYIAARFGVGAMEMTTAEIFAALKGDEDIPEDLFEEMKDLFERADFVKFAKYTAPDEDNKRVLPEAVRFVSSTYVSEVKKEDEEEKE